jgi:hypothetical protein
MRKGGVMRMAVRRQYSASWFLWLLFLGLAAVSLRSCDDDGGYGSRARLRPAWALAQGMDGMARKIQQQSQVRIEGITPVEWEQIQRLSVKRLGVSIRGICGESNGELKIGWRYVAEAQLANFRLIECPRGWSRALTLQTFEDLVNAAARAAAAENGDERAKEKI